MIQLVTGKNGEGKSLYAAWLIWQLIAERRCRVATNMKLTERHPCYEDVYFIGTDEYPIVDPNDESRCFYRYFNRDRQTVFVIDECHTWFDSQDWQLIPKSCRLYIPEHRKWQHDLVFISQYPANVWSRITRIAGEVVWCVKDSPINLPDQDWRMKLIWPIWPERWKRFMRFSYGSTKFRPSDYIRQGWFTMQEAAVIYPWYSTEQMMGTGA